MKRRLTALAAAAFVGRRPCPAGRQLRPGARSGRSGEAGRRAPGYLAVQAGGGRAGDSEGCGPRRARDELPRRVPEVPFGRLRRGGPRALRRVGGPAGQRRGEVARGSGGGRPRRHQGLPRGALAPRRHSLRARGRGAGPLRPRHRRGGLRGAARQSRLRGRPADPGRVLSRAVRSGRRLLAVGGRGGPHRHHRALQVGAPDGDHAAGAGLWLPVAGQHEPRAGPLRRLHVVEDRAPVWLQEGLAKFLERRWREPPGGRIPPPMEHLLAKALRSGHLISFEAMHPSMAKRRPPRMPRWPSPRSKTPSPTFTRKGGMAALREAISGSARGRRADGRGGGRRRRGGPSSSGAGAFHGRAALQDLPAIDIATTHIRKPNAIASGRKPAEEDALSPALKASAPFRYLRLGNMLLGAIAAPRPPNTRKGKKAVSASTRNDRSATWIFPVKLGRTYLTLGEPERALEGLAPVQAL